MQGLRQMIDTVIYDAVFAEEEKKPGRYIWMVWAKGLSWKRTEVPALTAAESAEGIPVGCFLLPKQGELL